MPLVDNQLAVRKAHLIAKAARLGDRIHDVVGILAVIMPRNEVRRDIGLLACRENRPEVRARVTIFTRPSARGSVDHYRLLVVAPCAESRAAYLDIGKLALNALKADNEKLDEEIASQILAALKISHALLGRRALTAVAVWKTPHAVHIVGLVPYLPVLYIPIMSVRPTLVVMTDRSCKNFGYLIEIVRNLRIEMDIRSGMFD